MKNISFFLPALLLLSCSKISGPTQEDLAMQAAKAYYNQLIHGDYNSFVEGSLQGYTVPADYKEQLLTNAKMFIEQQQESHKGISDIEAAKATCDSITGPDGKILVTATAYLSIHFKDNTKEEISVPMIRKSNIWYLR